MNLQRPGQLQPDGGKLGGPSNVSSGKNQRIAAPAESNLGAAWGCSDLRRWGAWVAGAGAQWIGAIIILIVICIVTWIIFIWQGGPTGNGSRASLVRKSVPGGCGWWGAVGLRSGLNEKLQADLAEGIARFEKINKDVYSLPWVVLVGRPQSGKSKMLSTSTVCKEGDRFKALRHAGHELVVYFEGGSRRGGAGHGGRCVHGSGPGGPMGKIPDVLTAKSQELSH